MRVIELTHSTPAPAPIESAQSDSAKVEAPKVEAPKVDTSKVDAQKVDCASAGLASTADPLAAPASPQSEGTHVAPKEQWLCEACAQAQHELFSQAKDLAEVWKLLKAQQPAARKQPPSVACPDCGMTLRDFRQRGRLGCPRDYEIFGAQLHDLLERLHGSARHVGRGPRQDESTLLRRRRLDELQQALASAIRDEAYEQAARLRDEIKSLEHS